jgi:hypothetical protein
MSAQPPWQVATEQLPPEPTLLHAVVATCCVGAQSLAVQQLALGMHELVAPQMRLPPAHWQVPGSPTQLWPLTTHSDEVQQFEFEMHEPVPAHACVAPGHEQVPPMPLHFSPESGQSASMQQVLLLMQVLKVAHSRCPVGQTQAPPWHTELPTVQSELVQQFDDGMQLAPQTFWPAGQVHMPPGDGQVWPATVQSPLVQQVDARMQLEVALHVL